MVARAGRREVELDSVVHDRAMLCMTVEAGCLVVDGQ